MTENVDPQSNVPVDIQYAMMKDQMDASKDFARKILDSGSQAAEEIHRNRSQNGLDILA